MADRSLLGVLVELLVNKQQRNMKQSNKPLSIVLLISFLTCDKCLSQYYGIQQYRQQQQQYYNRLRNEPYTLPSYDPRSVYYWNSQYNPNGPNYMFKYRGNTFGNHVDDFTVSGINTISQSTKNPDIQKNNPDAKSGLFAPKDTSKACIVVMRPKNDWAIVDWDIKLNEKKYDSIEAQSSRVLEVPSGEYSMTCGSMGIGSCIKFKASPGSTHFITAEWERFAVLSVDEGEQMYKGINEKHQSASKLTPAKNKSSYSTR